ncbi:hypothetical protein [Paracraurococcus lichenis]|uniref:DUF2147 domain-containing protein n=1 Tax=Paracraurococcus lichenis TaxID=3064888 RepID=A0ABT9DUU9_9PROT|nr:hypothetical protein [Paracraurococcus sp. LOR1-02]MDO9707672.1 hypothetical protein [Paracraurococcus sp. LOR1-02]
MDTPSSPATWNTTARVVPLVLALLLSTLGLSTARAQCAAPPLQGTWVNQDPDTGGIVRVDLHYLGGCDDTGSGPSQVSVVLHMWGRCTPTPCDWGERRQPVRDTRPDPFTIVWDFGFERTSTTIGLDHGRLWVRARTQFRDPDRPNLHPDETYWFEKRRR